MTHIRRTLIALFFGLASVTCWAGSVDINTATAEQLATAINGVGPSKARAIVQYRKAHGHFKSIEGLSRVRGIGAKTIDDNRDVLTVSVDSAPAASKTEH